MNRLPRLRTLAAAAALLAASAAQAAIVLSFTPSSQNVAVGGTAMVDVSISGLGSEVLSAFDINFVWDSTIATWSFVTVEPGCAALDGGIAGAVCGLDTVTQGNVGANGFSLDGDDDLDALQPDSFLIGSFEFTGLTDGVTYLTLGADLDFERNFVGRNALSLDVQVGSACLAVGSGNCTVPEPSSYALALLALAGAALPGALRRKRQA